LSGPFDLTSSLAGFPGMLLLTCEELSNTGPIYLQVTCNFILK